MSESIFPFLQDTSVATTNLSEELSIPREYAWDFNADTFTIVDGKLNVVTEKEAIKVWAMKALRTARFRYLAYSWNYGHDLENLVGQSFSKEAAQSEAMRYIREALLVNPNISEVKNVNVTLEESALKVECTVVTPYGEVKMSV